MGGFRKTLKVPEAVHGTAKSTLGAGTMGADHRGPTKRQWELSLPRCHQAALWTAAKDIVSVLTGFKILEAS